MATRPVFVPKRSKTSFVLEAPVDFDWSAGLSVAQKQKSILALHQAAQKRFPIHAPLEVSSKSTNPLGVALSAFNLSLRLSDGAEVSVESAFQSSKSFELGGPYVELLRASAKDAKRDPRLRDSGRLTSFVFEGQEWPLRPLTAFYDWLYLQALAQHPELAAQLVAHDAFTDIEFNPERSLNCQARSCALYVSLYREGLLDQALKDRKGYLDLLVANVAKRL